MSEYHENKRYLLNFKNVSAAVIILLLLVVAYNLGYHACMRVAVETGNAVEVDEVIKWKR